MWVLEKIGDSFNIPVKQYLVTDEADLKELPKGSLGDRANVMVNGVIVNTIYYTEEKGWDNLQK